MKKWLVAGYEPKSRVCGVGNVKLQSAEAVIFSTPSAKRADNLRPHYLKDLRVRLTRFAQEFGEGKLADIAPAARHVNRTLAAAKIKQLLKARRAGNGNGAPGSPESATSGMHLAPIVLATGSEPTAAFWAQLASGDSQRQVEKATAIVVVRKVLTMLAGEQRAKAVPISFQSEPVTLSDLCAVLETLTGGPSGWQTLLRLAERD